MRHRSRQLKSIYFDQFGFRFSLSRDAFARFSGFARLHVMLQCKIDIATKDKKARAGAIEYDELLFEQLRRLRRRLLWALAWLVGNATSAAVSRTRPIMYCFTFVFALRALLPRQRKLCKLAERLVGPTMSSHAAKRSAWNGSLYFTEVIVFAGYQLQFEPALLVV